MKRDYVVVGGGIVGVCAAYHLASQGKDVLLLERDKLASPPPVSSSGASARLFRTAYGSDQRMTKLCASSLRHWQYFEAESGERLFEPSGWVIFDARHPETLDSWPSYAEWPPPRFASTSADVMRHEGLPHEWLSKQALVERFPQIAANEFYDFALLDGSAGLLHAEKAVRVIGELARRAGAEIRENVMVHDMVWRNGRVHTIVTSQGDIELAATVILAAGYMNAALAPGSEHVLKTVGENMLFVRPDNPQMFASPQFPAVGHYAFPLDGHGTIHISPGGSTEHEVVVDPANLDLSAHSRPFHQTFLRRTREILRTWVPELADAPTARQSRCFYPVTRNGEYQLHKKANVVTLIACSSGTGFKTAPVCARLGTEMALLKEDTDVGDFTGRLFRSDETVSSPVGP